MNKISDPNKFLIEEFDKSIAERRDQRYRNLQDIGVISKEGFGMASYNMAMFNKAFFNKWDLFLQAQLEESK